MERKEVGPGNGHKKDPFPKEEEEEDFLSKDTRPDKGLTFAFIGFNRKF